MGVILGKLPRTHQAVQNPRLFMPVDCAKLKVAKGKIPIAPHLGFVNQHMGKAVHRLDPVGLPFHFGEIHVFPIVIEVAGFLPEIHLQNLRPHDHAIPALQMFLPLPILYQGAQHGPLGMEDDQPGSRLFADLEKIEIPSQLAVVPLFGLFDNPEILLQILPRGETGSIDTLEHLVPLVSAPVCAGDVEKLEGTDHGRRGDVRPPAEIGVAALPVKADGFHLFGQIL
ncbi:MAG: hypothetical protein A4E69_01200 [Syntrophus sp. PtaB.Bin138]|nr:MAG: hypothetical protein A4E69_01200 [Syntrophus sp. PtaB.Bin138]